MTFERPTPEEAARNKADQSGRGKIFVVSPNTPQQEPIVVEKPKIVEE